MKRTILISLALLLGCTFTTASAQNEEATPEQTKEAQTITKQMVKKYDLNKEQEEAFLLLNTKRVKALAKMKEGYDESKATAEQKAQMKARLNEEQTRYNSIVKELLSDKQYEKYKEQQAKEQAEAAEKSGEGKLSAWGPMVPGQSTVNLLGFGAQAADSLKIAQRQTDKMVRKYKLDQAQSEKLLALNLAEVQAEMDERRALAKGGLTQEQRGELTESAQKRSENYERYLKEIFTEAQYKKYTNAKKAQQSSRQRFGGPPPMMRF